MVTLTQEGLTTVSLAVIWGPSDFLVARAMDAVRKAWTGATNTSPAVIEGDELAGDKIADHWDQPALFGQRSLVVIQRLTDVTEFCKIFGRLPIQSRSSVTFVVSVNSDRLVKKLEEVCVKHSAQQVPCFPPHPNEIPNFVIALAEKKQIRLDRSGAHALITACAGDLFRIDSELAKLALIVSPGTVVAPHQIHSYCCSVSEDHLFKLDDLLLTRDFGEAQQLVDDLLNRGESGIAIIGFLARHCRNAIKIKCSGDTGGLALPRSVAKRYNTYVAHENLATYRGALELCHKADISLKTSSRYSETVLVGQVIAALSGF